MSRPLAPPRADHAASPGAAPALDADTAAAAASPAALDWIERLIRIDTVSRHSNLGLIEMVRDHLRGAGIEATLTRDASGQKANLFATVPAYDGVTQGGIVLSGHTDVVPVDGQNWQGHDPFRPDITDAKLYGRGACDMKGFIGTALALLPLMQQTKLARPLHFALSYDEEIGCAGAPSMIEDLLARGVRPDGCIVGEPTGMRPVVAHKGINAYRCCVRGQAAHSSLTPRGVNAIEYAARLICHIRDIADRFAQQGPYDDAFDVPFSTGQTGLISGGNAINTVPADCQFVFEYRNLPGIDAAGIFARVQAYAHDTLLPEMRRVAPGASIDFEQIATAPGLDVAEQHAITQLVRALTGDTETRKVAYGTEAGLFQKAGVPAVVCGPGHIEHAHKANEFVALEQIAACEDFLGKIVHSLSTEATA